MEAAASEVAGRGRKCGEGGREKRVRKKILR
jgi:hypothetical protein